MDVPEEQRERFDRYRAELKEYFEEHGIDALLDQAAKFMSMKQNTIEAYSDLEEPEGAMEAMSDPVTIHTVECQLYRGRVDSEQFVWDAKYPDYCKRCFVYGTIEAGDEDEGGPFADDCPECVGSLRCPRCAGGLSREMYEDREIVCSSCGWNAADPELMPAYYECECICPLPPYPYIYH